MSPHRQASRRSVDEVRLRRAAESACAVSMRPRWRGRLVLPALVLHDPLAAAERR